MKGTLNNRVTLVFSLVAMTLLLGLGCGDKDPTTASSSYYKVLHKQFKKEKEGYEKLKKLDSGVENQILLPFQNPPEINASHQELSTELNVKFTTSQLYNTRQKQNVDLLHRSYNGQLVGTTWRVKPGDSLFVKLQNQLPSNRSSEDCYPNRHHRDDNDPNQIDTTRFNDTNLHVHGLHVSPKGKGDNVLVSIPPGCEFENRIGIPENHAQGTFWYHGHVHGSTAVQVSSGMAGALIIEGGLDEQPLIKHMKERVFMFQQMPYMPNIRTGKQELVYMQHLTFDNRTWDRGVDFLGWRTTINGMTLPVIHMAPGEVQRWRMIHGGIRESLNIKVLSKSDGTFNVETLHVIAEDGIAYGERVDQDSMLLQPGYRADLLVRFPKAKTKDTLYLFDDRSQALGSFNVKDTESPKLLAIVVIGEESSQVEKRLPNSKELLAYAPYKSLVDVPVTTKEVEKVKFNIILNDPPGRERFVINGHEYEHDSVRILRLGDVQEWELCSGLSHHPFHIHVNHFQIIKKFKGDDKNGWEEQPVRHTWKDTYTVSKGEKVIIKTHYKDFTGDFVLHCHILLHEDLGMMERVRIDSSGAKSQGMAYQPPADIPVCGQVEKSNSVAPPD